MPGWVIASGRILGIVTCSALLLMSATLGQTGWASPARNTASAALVAGGHGERSVSTPVEVADTAQAEAPAPLSDSPPAPAEHPSTSDTSSSVRAGSGIYLPEQSGPRFNIATPVQMAPVRLRIPSLEIDAPIEPVGVTSDGQMEAPSGYWEVGWYRNGARPGDNGRAVIAGHLDSQDGAAIFYNISELQSGDEIRILLGGPAGERVFTVRETAQYPVDDVPIDQIFGPSDHPQLILITCDGDWQGSATGYSDRRVVYADMVGH